MEQIKWWPTLCRIFQQSVKQQHNAQKQDEMVRQVSRDEHLPLGF